MKTRERDNLAKYIIAFPKKRKLRDVRDYILKPKPQPEPDIRDYIIPMKKGRKTRWSERIDEVLYGKK